MSIQAPVEEEDLVLSKFIDFDKNENVFYDNLYIDDYKIVLKIPLFKKHERKNDITIEKFTLENYLYLFAYE
ncbi:MAG: hypothetical protein ACFFAS_11615 [Promethearchaeota archaeon]